MNYALLCSSQRECVLAVANKVRLSTRRSVAEAKELPFISAFSFSWVAEGVSTYGLLAATSEAK